MALAWGANLVFLCNDAYLVITQGAAELFGISLQGPDGDTSGSRADALRRAYAGEAFTLDDALSKGLLRSGGDPPYTNVFSPLRDEAGIVIGALHTAIPTSTSGLARPLETDRADDPGPDAVRASGSGKTERGCREAETDFLDAASQILANISDPAEIMRAVGELIGRFFEVSGCNFCDVDDAAGTVMVCRGWSADHAPVLAGTFRIRNFFSEDFAAAGRRGETFVVVDTETDRRTNAAAYAELGIAALATVPFRSGGRWTAYLSVMDDKPRQWRDDELALLREVSERLFGRVQKARAEAALRASEEQLRLVVELVPAMLWWTDPAGDRMTINGRWLTYTGQCSEDTHYFGWLEVVHPDDREGARAAFRHAFATGDPLEREQRIHRIDGEYRWHQVRHVPIRDASGRITHWFGAAIDIHESKLARQALDRSELFSRALVEGVPQLVWRAVDGGRWTWASPQWTAFTGQSESDSRDHGWLATLHPADRGDAMLHWGQAETLGRLAMDSRIRHADSGEYRWFHIRAMPVRAADGSIVEWLGTSTDVHDLRSLQERQRILVAELQHRVRNILTVVRSVFTRTVEGNAPLEEVVGHFSGRLDNLARTQVIVTQNASGEADLHTLIHDELLSVGAADSPGVTMDGPDIALPPSTAESIGLAIHELTTNALKYGALRVAGASLTIRWSINTRHRTAPTLDIVWTEQGVPAVPLKPSRQGFGSELIEEALPYRLGADTKLEFRGGGVRCTICVPLPDEAAAPTWETVS